MGCETDCLKSRGILSMSVFLEHSQFKKVRNKNQNTRLSILIRSQNYSRTVGWTTATCRPSAPTNRFNIINISGEPSRISVNFTKADLDQIIEYCKCTHWSFLLYRNNVNSQIKQFNSLLYSVLTLLIVPLVHYKL